MRVRFAVWSALVPSVAPAPAPPLPVVSGPVPETLRTASNPDRRGRMGPLTLQTPQASRAGVRSRHTVAIFLVSLAGLLLEVGYTRIVSYKLWYYYTYLVIGLALLGIGSGGIFVVVIGRLRRAATDSILAGCSLVGAALIAVGYVVVARIPIDTVRIWIYGTASSYKNLAVLGFVCFVLFASFIALGIIVATILGRASERVGRLYFADLIGAGLGCLCAIPLIVGLGPPEVIMLSALIFAAVGLFSLPRRLSFATVAAVVIIVVLAPLATGVVGLPDVRPEHTKGRNDDAAYSAWGPVFRVDVVRCRPPTKRGCCCTTARSAPRCSSTTATRPRSPATSRIPARSRSARSQSRPTRS